MNIYEGKIQVLSPDGTYVVRKTCEARSVDEAYARFEELAYKYFRNDYIGIDYIQQVGVTR